MNSTLYGIALLSALAAAGCAHIAPHETPPTATAKATAQPHANTPFYAWSNSMERKRLALENATQNTGIEVLRTTHNELQVNVPSDFSFDTDSSVVKADMRPVLDQVAEGLETKALSHMLIHIVGHTDSQGADAANETLSLARANSVRKHLEAKGIAAARIDVEGRGEQQPMISNAKGYGRALNRRVEIFLREPG